MVRAMVDFLRREQPSMAAIYFPGSAPPPAEAFGRLVSLGYELTDRRTDDALWAIGLQHADHGQAELLGSRDVPVIDEAIQFASNLTDTEKAGAMGSSAGVFLRMPARRKHALRDRKSMLRVARDILGDDGVMVIDVASELPWSRASLDDELLHDADLDVEGLYCVHNVLDDARPDADPPEVLWQHTHGLAELGRFDVDIVAPDPSFAASDSEMIRGIASGILEGNIGPTERLFRFGHPGGDARLVTASDFQRDADPTFTVRRDATDHAAARSVLCEPVGRKILGFGRGERPEPLRLARRPPPEPFIIYFPTTLTELMAERAAATTNVLRSLKAEFEEFDVVAIVKLGYPTADGGKEHLWFEAHAIGDQTIDATLENKPFSVELTYGERAERPLGLLTDWMLMTPAGPISPRSLSAARRLREHADEIRSARNLDA